MGQGVLGDTLQGTYFDEDPVPTGRANCHCGPQKGSQTRGEGGSCPKSRLMNKHRNVSRLTRPSLSRATSISVIAIRQDSDSMREILLLEPPGSRRPSWPPHRAGSHPLGCQWAPSPEVDSDAESLVGLAGLVLSAVFSFFRLVSQLPGSSSSEL